MNLAAIGRGATVLIATLILCLDSPQLTGRATVIVDIASLDPDRAELIRAHGVDGDGRFGTPVAGPMDMDREGHADFAMAYMRFSPLGRLGAGKVNLVFGHGAICAIIDTAVSQESGLKLPGDVASEADGCETWIGRQNHTPDESPIGSRIGAGVLSIVVGAASRRQTPFLAESV